MSQFTTSLARHGGRPALLFPRQAALSYAELDQRVADVAARLAGQKRLIAIEAAPTAPAIVAYLAALRAGHAVALLPAGEPAAIAAFAARFAPDLVIAGDGRLEPGPGRGEPVHPDLALILVTSGSTGQGKAVRLSGAALDANAGAIAAYLGLTPADRAALVLPLHYSYGLSVLHAHLTAGASLWLPKGGIMAPGFLDGLRRERCTNLAGVPYSFGLLESIEFRERAFPDLRFMTVAGGRLAPETVRLYDTHLRARGGQFFVMYGQTEATARIAYVPPERAARHPDAIGVAIPGGALSLVDDTGAVVTEPEVPGELVYRGPNVMMGYAAGRADLARGAEVDALFTGDLAVRGREGLYRIVGRRSRMSKIAGRRLGHDTLEAELAAGGIEAAVVGDDRSLLAVHAGPCPADQVRARLAAAAGLPLQQVQALTVEALPRLASGKLDYDALRGRLEANRPADPEGVMAAFREAFHPYAVAAGDSFASLGGDSLRHVELTLALERRLGAVPPDWETQTVDALARLARSAPPRRVIGSDLLIRAFAILLVVVHHATLWPLTGGSTAMVVLIGYGFGRYQREALATGDFARFFRPLPAVLTPYYLIVAAYALAWGSIPWASVFLVGNAGFADPVEHSMLPFLYWFVEVFVQLLLLWAAVFLIPACRRLAVRDPFAFGLVFLAAALAARFTLPVFGAFGRREIFTLPWVFYLSVFGWCAATADSAQRRWLLVAIAALVMPAVAYDGGNWIGSWLRYGLQFLVVAGLVFLPQVTVPAWVAALVLPLAAGSYYIYLFHRFAPDLILAPLEARIPAPAFALLAVVGGVAVGLAAHALRRPLRRAAAAARAWTHARSEALRGAVTD